MLYQRYFLRMNQSNTTHILSLLLALVLSLAAVQIILIPMESTSQLHRTLQRNRYNDTVNSNGSNISPALNRSNNNIANYTPNANSQQNFVRLNYNYSTDNETGNWLFWFVWLLPFVLLSKAKQRKLNQSTNHNGNSKSCCINITEKQTDFGRKIKSINNTYVNIFFWIFKWVTVNIQAGAMCYAIDVHMKRFWTIWKIIILCWQHQKRIVGSMIIIVSSKWVKGKNVALHQMQTIGIDGNNLFGMFQHIGQRIKK